MGGERGLLLAVDAGGTLTRAVILDPTGRCVGFGRAGGGNPTSAGVPAALESVFTATAMAAGQAAGRIDLSLAAVAMAGAVHRGLGDTIRDRLAPLGLDGPVVVEPDLLAMYHSGTTTPDGHVLVAGTGSVSAAVRGGSLETVADGLGWLVGDAGSGFWIGHRIVRRVADAIDGVAPPTALTGLLLEALGLTASAERIRGRPLVLMELIDRVYAERPVQLARFAPLAFRAGGDPAARDILTEAAASLARTLAAVRPAGSAGPVVLGGSVLGALLAGDSTLAEPLTTALGPAERIPVRDGLAGAAVLALLRRGIAVDDEIFDRVRRELAAVQAETAGEERVALPW
ncbi:MAG: glucosamine kinase [Microbacteriaceae bacterium]|nr:glucosamine kinase [Microbacteriaceae bacterium]